MKRNLVLVLDHLLISNDPQDGQVCGGLFEPADPEQSDSVATLTLMTAAGHITAKDEAALLLFEFYRNSAHTIHLGKSEYMMVSRSAIQSLKEFFLSPDHEIELHDRAKRIVETLATRL